VTGRRKVSEVRLAAGPLGSITPILVAISCVANLLALTGSLYMLQIYDRVISSQSVPTLIGLSILVGGFYLFQGALEVVRGQILVRLGSRVDSRLARQAHDAVMRLRSIAGAQSNPMQPIRDVDSIRTYLSGQGPVAILDMPWLPVYVAFIFVLHPVLGWITIGGALFLVIVTLLTEVLTRAPGEEAAIAYKKRWALAEASERNAEALRAMGFGQNLARRFLATNVEHIRANERMSDIVGGLSVVSKVFRLMLQSALLGFGAYYTIKGQMSAGAIIACSVAASRALAPIEIAIANWRAFAAARQSWTRLDALFSTLPADAQPLALPKPSKSLSIENLSIAVPGTQTVILNSVTFSLQAGTVLAVIGPSAAGKSTLARGIAGVWSPARGNVRVDGAALSSWSPAQLGRHVGFLPQDVQLFDGTITENIARFDEQPDSQKVLVAAQAADVHQMILRLPNGYETRIGQDGSALSAGQRQRIALARALYGEPFLVVLDEPNSNLDSDGELALTKAITGVKARGGIVIVIAHRPSVLAAADMVAVITAGQLSAIGPKDEILRKVLKQPVSAPAALALVSDTPAVTTASQAG
jgi:ATP-binding cassette subfamily C protein PrsD